MSANKKRKILFGVIGAVLAVVTVAVIIMIAVSSCSDEEIYAPQNTVTVTIDEPGIILTLGNQKNVIGAKNVGSTDIDPEYLKGIHFQTALERVIAEMKANGSFKGDANDAVIIMVESLKEDDYNMIGDCVQDVWNRHGYTAKILPLYIKARQRSIEEIAEQKGITYAKAYFCKKAAKESANLKAEELYGKTVAEIYKLLTEDKNNDHVNSVINSLNSSQAEIVPPESTAETPLSSEKSSVDTSSAASSSSSAPVSSGSSSVSSTGSSSQGGTIDTSMVPVESDGWIEGWH